MKSHLMIARSALLGVCLMLSIAQSSLALTATVQVRTGLEPAAVCETTATSTVSVTLQVADLVDSLGISGVQVRLSYDNSVLALNSGSSTELAGFTRITLTDSAGLITYAIVNNTGSVGPGAGPFSVATLVFDVIGEGNTSVTYQTDNPPFITRLTTAEQNPQVISGANLTRSPSGAISIDDTTATASSNSPVCEGDSLTLDGGTTGSLPNPPYMFSWSGPIGFSSNDADPEVSASATTAMSGTYTLTVTNGQGCTFQAMTEVVVNANPTCSITTDSPVCAGSSNTADGPAGMTTYVWSVIGGTLDMGQGTSQISYTAGAGPTVTIDLTVTDANGCSSSCQEIVTVETAPTADAGADQTICSGGNVTLDGTCGGAGGSLWTTSGDGTFGDDSMEDTTYTPGAADLVAGTVTLTLTCNGNVCPAAMDSLVVTIESAPTADAGADQTICSGNNVTLDGTCGGAGGSLWTTSGDGTFGDDSMEDTTYTPGAADLVAGTVTLTLTCSGIACPAAMDSLVVTIETAPTSNAGADQTICSGSNVTLDGTCGGAGGSLWTTSGDGTFGDDSMEDTTYTPGAADLVAGTVTLTLTCNGNVCPAAMDSLVVTIESAPTADAGMDQTICSGSNVTLDGTCGGAGGSLWTTSGDGTFGDDSMEDTTYTPGAADLVAGTVTLTLTCSGIACPAAMDSLVVTIETAPTADAGADQTICSGGNVTLNGTCGGAGGSLWTTSGDGTFSDDSMEDTTYTPGAADLVAGTVTLTLTCSGNGCPAAMDSLVVTIETAPTADAGMDQTICSGSNVTLDGTCGGAGGSLWTTSGDGTFGDDSMEDTTYTPGAADLVAGTVTLTLTCNGNVCPAAMDSLVVTIETAPTADAGMDQTICSGSNVTLDGTCGGAGGSLWTTSGDGTFGDDSMEDTTYTPGAADLVAGTVTLTLTCNGNVCPAAMDSLVVTIETAPTADAGMDQTICSGSNVTLDGTCGGAGGSLWTTSGDGTFGDDSMEDTTYTPGAADLVAGTVTLTLTCNGNVCPAAMDSSVVTIETAPTADAGADQTICSGSNVTLDGTCGGAGGSLWTTSGDGTFGDDSMEDTTYTPGAADLVAGTVTLTLTCSGNGCPAAMDSLVVTIESAPTADAGADQTICSGSNVTLDGTCGGAGGSLWTTSGDGTFGDDSMEDTTYTPGAADLVAGTVTLTLTCSGIACPAAMDSLIVTIETAPTADAGADQTICSGGNVTLDGTCGGAGGSLWTTSGDGTFGDDSMEDTTYTPGAADLVAGTVTLTLTCNGNVCPAAMDSLVVTIESAPTADAGMDQTICSGSNVTLDGTCGGAGGSLWTTSGDGTFGDDSMEDTTYTPGAADLVAGTVTLTLTCNGNVCPAAMDSLVVTIETAPTADAGADQTICSGSNVTLDGTCGGAGGSLWTTSGDGTFGDDSMEDTTYTPGAADLVAGTVTLTLTCNGNVCPAAMDSLVVTIESAPTADAGMDQTICSGSNVTLDGTCGGAGGSLWTTSGDGTFGDDSMEDTTYTPGAADLVAGTVTLTLTCSGIACPAAMDSLVVTIETAPTSDAGADQTICSGSNVTLDGTCGGAGGSLWTTSGDGTFGDDSMEDTTYTPGAADLVAGTVTLTLTCSGNVCPAAMDSLVVTIQTCVTVNLEVPGLIGNAAEGEHVADRSVQFDLTACPGSLDTRIQTVDFKRTGSNGTATVVLATPNPSATWLSVVEGHTLRRRVPIDLSGDGSDTVTVSLISGDVHTATVSQDALVDIVDFSILASRWNTVVSDCVGGDPEDCARGADVTGDGIQDTADFTAMQINFFIVGDDVNGCGAISPPSNSKKPNGQFAAASTAAPAPTAIGPTGLVGRKSISIVELATIDAQAVQADFNHDGTVDSKDIRLFARQQGLPLLQSFDLKLKAIEASNLQQGN